MTIRRSIVGFCLFFGGVILLLALSQVWLPWVLPFALGTQDVEVGSIERVNGGRIVLREISFRADSIKLDADQIEIPNLYQYLSFRFMDKNGEGLSSVNASNVEVAMKTDSAAELDVSRDRNDPVAIIRELRDAKDQYADWLPQISVNTLRVTSGEHVLDFEALQYGSGRITTQLKSDWLTEAITLAVEFPEGEEWFFSAAQAQSEVSFNLTLRESSAGYFLSGIARRQSEQIECSLELEEGEILPKTFSLLTKGFTVEETIAPALLGDQFDSIKLNHFQFDWSQDQFRGAAEVEAIVTVGEAITSPINAKLQFSGDMEHLTVQSFLLNAPFGDATLRESVSLKFQDGLSLASQVDGAMFDLSIDLAKQSFVDAEGVFDLKVSVSAKTDSDIPNLRFELEGHSFRYSGHSLDSIKANGRYSDNTVAFDSLQVLSSSSNGDSQSEVELKGVVDLFTRELDLNYELDLGSQHLNEITENSIFGSAVKLKGRVSGAWVSPVVTYDLASAELVLPRMNPVSVSGSGRIEKFDTFYWDGIVGCEGASLSAGLSCRYHEGVVNVDLQHLALADKSFPELVMFEPVSVVLNLEPEKWLDRVSVSRVQLKGGGQSLETIYGPGVGLALSMNNVSFARFNRWLSEDLPAYEVESLVFKVDVFEPFISGEVFASAALRLPGEIDSFCNLRARLDPTGVEIEALQLKIDDAYAIQGAFVLPVRFGYSEKSGLSWELLEHGKLAGEMSASLIPVLADFVAENTALHIGEGSLQFKLSGDLDDPVGELQLSLKGLELGSQIVSVHKLPVVDTLRVVATLDSESVDVSDFRLSVNQSELFGQMQLPVSSLIEWLYVEDREPISLAKSISGELRLDNWQLEQWIHLMPDFFRRSGALSGVLTLEPDIALSGVLEFDDFAFRPTENFSSIDRISGKLQLANKRLDLSTATAHVGGSQVNVSGWVDLANMQAPLWDLKVAGKNVPLLRTTDMLLRSDVDLEAKHLTEVDLPVVRGRLDLRSSTLLLEFDPLGSGIASGPKARPPYFSIEQDPFKEWLFDVTVFGESFMRVKSPYSKTLLSADLYLGGSFQYPELSGLVRTVDGELTFPGAKMSIDKGEVFIDPARLNEVQLVFSGIAQSPAYTITMEVTNTLDEPFVQFSSTPELSNASILRLLTTGSTTGGGVGAVGLYLGRGLLGAGGMNETVLDRVTIELGDKRSRSGRRTVGAEFDISDDWGLKGEYDEYDAYNMNLLWNLFRR
ncbi:MAG: translocation/assembly module TamB domain-containing protein [Opitutaceae bacterium]